MDKIPSFKIDHNFLERGVHKSREDFDGKGNPLCTTFDIRIIKPNTPPYMDTDCAHTIEHLGATYLRIHSDKKNDIVYFGPMGCRTGFYLILKYSCDILEVRRLIIDMFNWIANYTGEIPGATKEECGNYLDHNLAKARVLAKQFLDEVLLKEG